MSNASIIEANDKKKPILVSGTERVQTIPKMSFQQFHIVISRFISERLFTLLCDTCLCFYNKLVFFN